MFDQTEPNNSRTEKYYHFMFSVMNESSVCVCVSGRWTMVSRVEIVCIASFGKELHSHIPR